MLKKFLNWPALLSSGQKSVPAAADGAPNINYITQLERNRLFSGFRRLGNNRSFLILVGTSGAAFGLALYEWAQIKMAQNEIARRKTQLSQPVYELKGEEKVNFPWTAEGERVDNWLHRPVKISGKPRHEKTFLVPRTVDGYFGYDYIVPLITKDTEDGSEEYGVLLNKGWIPHEYASPNKRYKIENVEEQTFVGYVSRNEDLERQGIFDGNVPDARFNKWTHVFLPDMAKASGFKNQKQVKAALIECIDQKLAPLDERNTRHYAREMTGSFDYPFAKTQSGALQLTSMPWDHRHNRNTYLGISIATGAIAVLTKFV